MSNRFQTSKGAVDSTSDVQSRLRANLAMGGAEICIETKEENIEASFRPYMTTSLDIVQSFVNGPCPPRRNGHI